MVEGAVRHGTSMQVEANYTDSHGQSEIGFGITRLIGFDLLLRIKRINYVKLYRAASGEASAWPGLAPAMMGRAIRWDLIAEQYDQMIKYATAIRTGPRRRRRSCAGSPAPPHTPRIRRCWRSAGPSRRHSWRGTCVTGTCNARSTTA
jgi:hypothetical protein